MTSEEPHGKRKSTDANDKITKMVEISDKYIKVDIKKILVHIRVKALESKGKLESHNKETEGIKNNQLAILEPKNTFYFFFLF